MSRGILDTSVLIADDVTPLPGDLAISVLSLAEFAFWCIACRRRWCSGTAVEPLSAMQRRFDPLPVDEVVAESYGLLASRVAVAGRQPRARVVDLLIAATARAHDATLHTRNIDDLRDSKAWLRSPSCDSFRSPIVLR